VEIINTASRLCLASCFGSALLLSSTSLFATELILHKVPPASAIPELSPQPSSEASGAVDASKVAFVSYQRAARPLYVSSGQDFAQANSMIDDQISTSYSFAPNDRSPTTVIDLGQASTLRRLTAIYAPHAGKIEFYVLQAMPNAAAEGTPDQVTLDEATLARMKSVGTATDDGSLGRVTIEFPAAAGRYVMVRWTPAAQQDAAFSIAEVSAVSDAPQTGNVVAAARSATTGRIAYDGKTALDGKTMMDGKEMMPGEGPEEAVPESPGEGPPPTLPQPPPFAFVPVLVPVSP
jgi:hypothetical protein